MGLAVPYAVRRRGLHLPGAPGVGKSRLMGRQIAFWDFAHTIPTFIIDPTGPTIDNFLDKFMYLPPQAQLALQDRLVYFDMSGKSGYVPGFPIYYRHPGDTLYEVAYRFLDLTKKLDPYLESAPIRGWNAIKVIGVYVGMVLSALGEPITQAYSLLTETDNWLSRINQLPSEADPAKFYFTNVYKGSEKQKADSFLPQIIQFTADERMRSMFGAKASSIDWKDVVENKKIVLLDLRNDDDPRFKINWAFLNFLEFIRMRGHNRDNPVSFIIDELSYLLATESDGHDPLSNQFDDLVNNISRNYNVWLTLAHQELYRLPKLVQNNLLSLGIQILGRTSDDETALLYARRFTRYNHQIIKRHDPIYDRGMLIDQRPLEFNIDEQQLRQSFRFRDLQEYQFLGAVAYTEGGAHSPLQPLDMSQLDPGQYVNEARVEQLRSKLVKRSGVPVLQNTAVTYKVPARYGSNPSTNPRTSIPAEIGSK